MRPGSTTALIASTAAGVATLALVHRRRYEPARYSAALAVATVVAGWGLAQAPTLLPGLTIEQAAAPRNTLVALAIAVIAGGIILFPALGLLFRLLLGGALEPGESPESPGRHGRLPAARAAGRGAIACLVLGTGFLVIGESDWTHAIGASALLTFVVLASRALIPIDRN
jgi:cytochrome bd ubiquinol oxidase subunit II